MGIKDEFSCFPLTVLNLRTAKSDLATSDSKKEYERGKKKYQQLLKKQETLLRGQHRYNVHIPMGFFFPILRKRV
jgi:hypothetical protein